MTRPYIKAQALPVPNFEGTGGYARSTRIAADAAQFRFWTYTPEALAWTVTGQAKQIEDPAPFRFVDVADPSQYYFAPVYWALEQGVTSGTSATEFSPNRACTRAQIVTFLYRVCGR